MTKPARRDTLPATVADCDRELRTCAQALPELSEKSRALMLARVDKLLDRRLLLGVVADRPKLAA